IESGSANVDRRLELGEAELRIAGAHDAVRRAALARAGYASVVLPAVLHPIGVQILLVFEATRPCRLLEVGEDGLGIGRGDGAVLEGRERVRSGVQRRDRDAVEV